MRLSQIDLVVSEEKYFEMQTDDGQVCFAKVTK